MRKRKLQANWKKLKGKVLSKNWKGIKEKVWHKVINIKHKPIKIGLITLGAGALSGLIYFYRHKK